MCDFGSSHSKTAVLYEKLITWTSLKDVDKVTYFCP